MEQRRSGQQRVRHQASPRAAEGQGSPGESVTLAAIERLIEIGTGKVITALEARFERFERRLDVLETECFEKDIAISKLQGEIETLRKDNVEMREQIEGIDINRRMSSLILHVTTSAHVRRMRILSGSQHRCLINASPVWALMSATFRQLIVYNRTTR